MKPRRTMKIRRILAAITIAFLGFTGLTACSSAEPVNPQDYAMIIDVRTPEEWNSGHIEGAVRIGIADADFASQLDELDKSADYYIYCRSGNRAGQAIDYMKSVGFTGELVNGGAVANASSALGLPVVK